VGFLLTGIFVGPYGFGLVKAVHEVEIMAEIELRAKYGVTVLAIRRNSQILSNPSVNISLYSNDVLFVLGPPDSVAVVAGLSQNPDQKDVTQ
jgi:uncharacterized protein with PhoU and TrkA domain